MDLCVMASKLAYENAKMNLVEFLDRWNEYQKQMATQFFILTYKQKDTNLILISFRGAEPFDADDWGNDFDYSWYKLRLYAQEELNLLQQNPSSIFCFLFVAFDFNSKASNLN